MFIPLIHRIQIVGEESDLEAYQVHNVTLYRAYSTSSRSSTASSRRIMLNPGLNNQIEASSRSRLENRIIGGGAGSISGHGKDDGKEENMKRKCVLDMNRIKVEFKWKGAKPHFRSIRVRMVISVVKR